MLIESLDPEYVNRVLNTADLTLSAVFSVLNNFRFDDALALVVRPRWLDDGHVRVWDSTRSIDILTILKEISNTFYNISISSVINTRLLNTVWIHGSEITNPAANTALVSKTVSANRKGYIYGFYITADEANDFKINWISNGTAYSIRIKFPGAGSLHYIDIVPMNEGLAADSGTNITITNVNAGSGIYQARIFYYEV